MSGEENKDLNKGEKTPTGNDRPDKKNTDSSDDEGATGATGASGAKDEKVEISKSELEKLKQDSLDKEDLRKAVIRLNKDRKGRNLPGSKPDRKKPTSEEDEEEDGEADEGREELLTKKDLQTRDEKSAIRQACKDPIIDEHWDEIMEHYAPKHGKDSVEDILADIETAKDMFLALNPQHKPKPEDKGKRDTADLAADKEINKGKERDTKPSKDKKTIIPKKEKMEDWYKKDKKE